MDTSKDHTNEENPIVARNLHGYREQPEFKHGLLSRRVLPMWSRHQFTFQPIMVDDEGSCKDQHIFFNGMWHRYQDEYGRMYVVRCPHMLTVEEKSAVVLDDPVGSWLIKVEPLRQEKLRIQAMRNIVEREEQRRNKWSKE